jgi:hypothetical protein
MSAHRIYIDLDSLMDTRLPILHELDPEFVEGPLLEKYRSRISDDWSMLGSKVTREEWVKAWQGRGYRHLAQSARTCVVEILWESVLGINWALDSDAGSTKKVNIDINFWPYECNADERRVIVDAVASMLPSYVKVDAIFNPVTFMHPKTVTGQWDLMYIYDLFGWLRQFANDFEEVYMLNTTVVTPELISMYATPTPEELKLVKETPAFRVLEASWQGRMKLRCLPVEEWCVKPIGRASTA